MKSKNSSLRFEITQSTSWEAFQKAAGRDTYLLGLKSGERALFVKFKLPLGRTWLLGLGVDFKSFIKEDFDMLISYAKSIHSTHIRCEGFSNSELLLSYKLKDVSKSYLPQHTIKIDLTLSEEEILAQMKRKGRYNIKVARKAGVEVFSFSGKDSGMAEALDQFYNVLEETGGRDGFGIHTKEYYSKMLNSLGKDARLYVAKLNEKVISGMIVIYSETEAVYYYGASSNSDRNVMAPYLLQWTAMTDSKKASKSWYDFMGVASPIAEPEANSVTSNPSHVYAKDIKFEKSDPLYGVTEFKQKFGGKLFIFEKPVDLVVSSFWYFVASTVKKMRG